MCCWKCGVDRRSSEPPLPLRASWLQQLSRRVTPRPPSLSPVWSAPAALQGCDFFFSSSFFPQLYWTHTSYLMSHNMLSVVLPHCFLGSGLCLCAHQTQCLFCVCGTHLLAWFVFFEDMLKDFLQLQDWMSDSMFENKCENGDTGFKLHSRLQPPKKLSHSFWSTTQSAETSGASNMTCRINYASLLITALVLFIIRKSLFTDPHAVRRHCSFQSVLIHGSNSHPLWKDTQGHFVVFICTIKLLIWLTQLSLLSPVSPPFPLLRCPSASRWQSPSPSAASAWGPRSRIAIRGRRNSSPAPTVAIVVSARQASHVSVVLTSRRMNLICQRLTLFSL